MTLVAGVKGYQCGVYESKTHSERLRPEPSSPCAVTYPERGTTHILKSPHFSPNSLGFPKPLTTARYRCPTEVVREVWTPGTRYLIPKTARNSGSGPEAASSVAMLNFRF